MNNNNTFAVDPLAVADEPHSKNNFQPAGESFEDIMESINHESLVMDDIEPTPQNTTNQGIPEPLASDHKYQIPTHPQAAPHNDGVELIPSEVEVPYSENHQNSAATEPAINGVVTSETIIFGSQPVDLPLKSGREEVEQAKKDALEANDKILDSISLFRRSDETYEKKRQELGLIIHSKRRRCKQLQTELSGVNPNNLTELSDTVLDEEVAAQSHLMSTVNCQNIIGLAGGIQNQLAHGKYSDLPHDDVDKIGQEVDILRARMEYIRLLKEVITDIEEYQGILKEQKNNKARFQSYRSFFS